MQHHGAALRGLTDDRHARSVAGPWRDADLGERLAAILAYAERLTLEPAALAARDVRELRAAGLDDEAILHVAEVASYFNFVNRLADGLGVPLEADWDDPLIEADP